MTIHYHGTPITPVAQIENLAGKHFCLSYPSARRHPAQQEMLMRHAQSLMYDSGAFSSYNSGKGFDKYGYYLWAEKYLAHPHWAVMPDYIDGPPEYQRRIMADWPFPKELSAPVWHLALSFDWLLELIDNYPKICLGSSGQYWKIGGPEWTQRMDEVFEFLTSKRRHLPWIHGMRMMSQVGGRWPLASVDSTTVAQGYRTRRKCPGCMADGIDAINGPLVYRRA